MTYKSWLKSVLSLVKLILVMALAGQFVQAEVFRIFTVNEPPANYINSSGEPDGYVVDIVKAMQKKTGDKSTIEFLPEARALKAIEVSPDILFFSLSKTPERSGNFHWVAKVMSKKWQVYALKKSEISIDNLEQLKKLSEIGTVRGDVREEWLVNHKFTNLHSVTQHSQNIQRLLAGRIPAIVYEKQGLFYLCKEMNIDVAVFESVYTINESDVFITLSKKTSLDKVHLWQEAFEQLKKTGEIEKISLAWQAKLKKEFNITTEISQGVLVF